MFIFISTQSLPSQIDLGTGESVWNYVPSPSGVSVGRPFALGVDGDGGIVVGGTTPSSDGDNVGTAGIRDLTTVCPAVCPIKHSLLCQQGAVKNKE